MCDKWLILSNRSASASLCEALSALEAHLPKSPNRSSHSATPLRRRGIMVTRQGTLAGQNDSLLHAISGQNENVCQEKPAFVQCETDDGLRLGMVPLTIPDFSWRVAFPQPQPRNPHSRSRRETPSGLPHDLGDCLCFRGCQSPWWDHQFCATTYHTFTDQRHN